MKFTSIAARACRIDGIPKPVGFSVVGEVSFGEAEVAYALADLNGSFPVLYSDLDQASVAANNLVGEEIDFESWELIYIRGYDDQTNN